jgi:cardiolipin synthase
MTLAAVIAGMAEECSASDAAAFTIVLPTMGPHDAATRSRLNAALLSSSARALAARLDAAWASAPATTGQALALAFGAALVARERAQAAVRATLVVTGPEVSTVPVRQTRAVVLELVAAATQSIVLSTFSAGRVDDLVAALRAAHDRGVRVSLVLETSRGSAGYLVRDAREAFAALRGAATIYHWPLEHRAVPAGVAAGAFAPHALLHAKTLVIDASIAFVTSANVSETAMERSIEAGIIVRGGDVPRQLAQYWDGLIAKGVLMEA